MMSYKLIQPAVNIGIGIGTADLMANVIIGKLWYRYSTTLVFGHVVRCTDFV